MSIAACPLPRWPVLAALMRERGWRVHHLAALLGLRPSRLHAYLHGREQMPRHRRQEAERLLGLEPGSLS